MQSISFQEICVMNHYGILDPGILDSGVGGGACKKQMPRGQPHHQDTEGGRLAFLIRSPPYLSLSLSLPSVQISSKMTALMDL